MRILHVINNGSTCGGAERLTADLVERQRADGHRVHVLAGDRPGPGDWYADSTWPVRAARGLTRLRDFYYHAGAREALSGVLARFAPDVVHLHTVGLLSAGALPLLRDVPTVMTVHGPELFLRGTVGYCLPARYHRGGDQVGGRLGARGVAALVLAELVTGPVTRHLLRRHVDVLTAPSPYLADLVERSVGPTLVIRNGLHGGYRTTVRAPVTPDRGPRLVTVGRLEQTKGVQVLLDALPAVLAAYPAARLTVCGAGPMRDRLLRRAADLGVRHAVTFAGWCSPADVAEVLAGSDVAVVPSIRPESFGMTALEALATGCAVVASDVGGLPDLVRHGETGLLVPPGDPVALAAAVTRLLDDPALRARLSVGGSRLAARLTLDAYATQVQRVYDGIRSGHESTAPQPGRP